MKSILLTLFACVIPLTVAGCAMFQFTQPLRLYELGSGTTIEVYFQQTSHDHGTLAAKAKSPVQYHGECSFGREYAPSWYHEGIKRLATADSSSGRDDLPGRYGFGPNADARPAGTGILVGDDGNVIELIFYRVSGDLQSADGIGRDNKGRFYRIFLSTKTM